MCIVPSVTKELHCYEYVNRSFDDVRNAVVGDSLRFLGPATDAAAQRARVLVDTLKVTIAGIEVGKKVLVQVGSIQPHATAPGHIAAEALRVEIGWEAASQGGL